MQGCAGQPAHNAHCREASGPLSSQGHKLLLGDVLPVPPWVLQHSAPHVPVTCTTSLLSVNRRSHVNIRNWLHIRVSQQQVNVDRCH